MRQIYTLIFYAALPFVLLRLYWRGLKVPDYRRRWRERLGWYGGEPLQQPVIWVHCVSVGEAEAAFPLIRLLKAEQPAQRFLVTTTTPTGSARVRAAFKGQVEHVYLPYDLPGVLERFFTHFRPQMAVFMEKEIWPNLFAKCAQRQIPLFIINARLSARSAPGYKKISHLIKPALACVEHIAVQTAEDRGRFIDIGAEPEKVSVLGNLKFDLALEDGILSAGRALRQEVFAGRYVWILASTHHGEESLLLPIYQALKTQIANLLLVIAPRHPDRFQAVKADCEQQGFKVSMRSEGHVVGANIDIYLADSMGELKMLYAAADVAFVGGSLVTVGGHNVLEPALVGVPIIFGPHMFNFKEIAERILAERAAVQCPTPETVLEAVLRLKTEPDFAQAMTARAKAFVLGNQGATRRIADLLLKSL